MAEVRKWKAEYTSEDSRVIAQKSCTQSDPMLILRDRNKTYSHFFNTKVNIISQLFAL